MNKDKVRELVDAIFLGAHTQAEYKRAERWLEQNQPEPVVVGLSDEQVRDLAGVVSSVDYDDFHTTRYDVLIQNYLKTQTFAQSVEFSSGELADSYQSLYEDFRKVKKELEQLKLQQEVKEVTIGLSDEQIYNLYDWLANAEYGFVAAYKEWAKTQTFTQSSEAFKAAMEEVHIRNEEIAQLKEELEQLKLQQEVKEVPVGLSDEQVDEISSRLECVEWGYKGIIRNYLKTQTFAQPAIGNTDSRLNWDDAPKNAESFQLKGVWLCGAKVVDYCVILDEQRPKPTPVVELESVWHYGAIEATVRCVNDYEVVLCNNYSGIFSVIAVTDFLAKFKRVG
jgi:hypothetical protein